MCSSRCLNDRPRGGGELLAMVEGQELLDFARSVLRTVGMIARTCSVGVRAPQAVKTEDGSKRAKNLVEVNLHLDRKIATTCC